MALVGAIEQGTISRILRSVRKSGSDAVILCEREGQFAHVVFEQGQIVEIKLGALEGEMAVRALERWSGGVFILLKRAGRSTLAKGHVLIVDADERRSKALEKQIEAHGFEASVVPFHSQLVEVVTLLKPDCVLLSSVLELTEDTSALQDSLSEAAGQELHFGLLDEADGEANIPHVTEGSLADFIKECFPQARGRPTLDVPLVRPASKVDDDSDGVATVVDGAAQPPVAAAPALDQPASSEGTAAATAARPQQTAGRSPALWPLLLLVVGSACIWGVYALLGQ